jgi:hypothetical protein
VLINYGNVHNETNVIDEIRMDQIIMDHSGGIEGVASKGTSKTPSPEYAAILYMSAPEILYFWRCHVQPFCIQQVILEKVGEENETT